MPAQTPPKQQPPKTDPPTVPSFVGTSLVNMPPIHMVMLGGLALLGLIAFDQARRLRQVEREVADLADLASTKMELSPGELRGFIARKRKRAGGKSVRDMKARKLAAARAAIEAAAQPA